MADPLAPEVDPRKFDERRQAPTVSRDTLDCRDHGSLDVGASVGLRHLNTYKVLGNPSTLSNTPVSSILYTFS
jgi:hypothetical protein